VSFGVQTGFDAISKMSKGEQGRKGGEGMISVHPAGQKKKNKKKGKEKAGYSRVSPGLIASGTALLKEEGKGKGGQQHFAPPATFPNGASKSLPRKRRTKEKRYKTVMRGENREFV